ncbi:MAG: amylosucrase, partial [Lachnospiraceae bacterium]|nr:amylosucrase [Lachnospiraceae bacterium]
DEEAMEKAIRLDVMLHAYMFMQSGIPVLYSGDEIAQVNDYSYKENPDKAADSRYIHRGAMDWKLVKQTDNAGSIAGQIFSELCRLETIRKSEKVFVTQADAQTMDTGDAAVLCMTRYYEDEKLVGLFNFSEYDKTVSLQAIGIDGKCKNMISGRTVKGADMNIPAYGFYYLKSM